LTAGLLFTAAGYVVGGLVFYLVVRRQKRATEAMAWVALAGLAGGVLGAKLTEWLLGSGAGQTAGLFDPRLGGRALIGGLVVGWLAVEAAKWRLGIRRSTGDAFALALPAGEAVGRLGCFFNGCCYGVATTAPWAVVQHGAPRHPAQLYAAAAAMAIFGALLVLRDRLPREGDLFRLYLVLFGASRFGLEFLRERSIAFGGLSLAQWVCLELAVAGAAALALSVRRVRTPA
jgi:phosphatidylglycerol:prolipoprotein diacylglycerol transferase